jgi:hypothetical protein
MFLPLVYTDVTLHGGSPPRDFSRLQEERPRLVAASYESVRGKPHARGGCHVPDYWTQVQILAPDVDSSDSSSLSWETAKWISPKSTPATCSPCGLACGFSWW